MEDSQGEPSVVDGDNYCSYWTLDNIPKEILLHICSFLSMKFITDVLRNVCKRFMEIIDDDTTWKIRLKHRWPKKYPLIKSEGFTWHDACRAREEAYRLWTNQAANMKKCHIASAHFAVVDVVHLIENGRFCASGSRDHAIKLWDMEMFSNNAQVASCDFSQPCNKWIERAHTGWIWGMAYSGFDKTLYSGSWDGSIKSWDIDIFTSEKNRYQVSSAVLCLSYSDNVVTCGRFDKKISSFDARAGSRAIFEKVMHRLPILCMTANEKYIISGSEDHCINVFDRIAGKIHKTIELEGFPMSLSYEHNHLWLGDNLGFIHLIDPTSNTFELIKSYPSCHKKGVSGIHFSLGAIFTCSLDKSVSVLEPSADPKPIVTIPYQSQVARISAHKNVLVSANSDSSITMWIPCNSEEQCAKSEEAKVLTKLSVLNCSTENDILSDKLASNV